MGFLNGWMSGVAEARPQAIGELAPANWGGVCLFVVSLYA